MARTEVLRCSGGADLHDELHLCVRAGAEHHRDCVPNVLGQGNLPQPKAAGAARGSTRRDSAMRTISAMVPTLPLYCLRSTRSPTGAHRPTTARLLMTHGWGGGSFPAAMPETDYRALRSQLHKRRCYHNQRSPMPCADTQHPQHRQIWTMTPMETPRETRRVDSPQNLEDPPAPRWPWILMTLKYRPRVPNK